MNQIQTGKTMKRKLICKSFLIGALAMCAPLPAPGQGTRNPIIHADVPDMAMIRVGDTYYMSSTTMHMSPGLPIMKSKDLVNWEMAAYAYDVLDDIDELNLNNGKNSYGRGTWASSIRHHKGTYYVTTFAQTTGKTHIFTTQDIEKGPWKVNSFRPSLHDHSLFFDDDGRVYMIYGGGDLRLVELTADVTGLKPGGFNEVVIKDATAVAGPNRGLNAEGSQMLKHDGKYYVFNITWPRGGMRTVLVHRADRITGPYEGRVALQDKGVAQGSLIDTPTGEWFAYLFRDFGAVGRIPYLVPAKWQDGWPVIGENGKVPEMLDLPAGKGLIPGIVASDEFDRKSGDRPLPMAWQWNHNPDNKLWSLTDRRGFLRLTTGRVDGHFLAARNTLTQRTLGPQCSGTTAVDVGNLKDGDFAGLALLQKNYGLVGVMSDGGTNHVVMVSAQSGSPVEVQRVPLNQKTVYLKADCDFKERADTARFSYSLDGKAWSAIGEPLKMSYTLPHFMGYRIGLFNYATKTPGGHADFAYFRVSDRIGATPDAPAAAAEKTVPGANPIIRDVFTADPAPLVVGDTVYLYAGRDNAKGKEMFTMPEWLCFSSKDMKNWKAHGPVLKPTDFSWGEKDSAWASQVIRKGDKYYFYATLRGDGTAPGNNIGVAVADSPTGPFKDAIGKPLVRNDMTPVAKRPWEDIDPTVFIDGDGTPWMSWGNGDCYLVKLKQNMIELDGRIEKIDVPHYVEGPWLHKRDNLYYLTYAAMAPPHGSEQIAYATSDKITGPWKYRGIITGPARNSFTIHPGIIEFNDQWYFFYHFAGLTLNGETGALGRRAVCVEYLDYNPDGSIKPVTQTVEGVSVPPKK
jgi:beta-xylosidase